MDSSPSTPKSVKVALGLLYACIPIGITRAYIEHEQVVQMPPLGGGTFIVIFQGVIFVFMLLLVYMMVTLAPKTEAF